MQKVKALFEQYVQWLALGLGTLYLGWTIWTYLVNPPLKVSLGSQVALPGQAETAVVSGPITKIENELRDSKSVEIIVPSLLDSWNQTIALSDLTPKTLAGVAGGPPQNIDSIIPGGGGGGSRQEKDRVTQLVVPPAAVPVAASMIRTVALLPPPNAAPAAGAGAADGGGAAAAPAAMQEDKDLVSVLFKVESTKLSDAYKKAFRNPKWAAQSQLFQTLFLQTEVVREEQLADGTWGNPTTVPPLSIHQMEPFPGDVPNPGLAIQYQKWAQSHVADIISPAAYDTAPGAEPWHSPDQPAGAPKPGTPGAPAAPAGPGTPGTPRVPTGTGTPAGPGAGQAPYDADNPPIPKIDGLRGKASSGVARVGFETPRGLWGSFRPSAQIRPPTAPPTAALPTPSWTPQPVPGAGGDGAAAAGAQNPSQGPFNPLLLNADIPILAHDDTVKPGKTYRYKIRYRLLNTLFGTQGVADPAKLADTFAVVSEFSAPCAPVSVPSKLVYFIASIYKNDVKFDVFSWKGGHWHRSQANAGPGDAIAGTDSTIVDIRTDDFHGTDQRYALLMNSSGEMVRHDVRGDQNNPDHSRLLNESKAGETADAGGAASPR